MTDAAYKAKLWLEQLSDFYADAEKTRREIELIESRINCAVSSYEHTGAGRADLIVRQQQHEDALLNYSVKREEYERKYMRFVKQEFACMILFEQLGNRLHGLILFDRYINRIKFDDMPKLKRYEIKKRQIYRTFTDALEELAPLLDKEEPQAIQAAEDAIKNYIAQASA